MRPQADPSNTLCVHEIGDARFSHRWLIARFIHVGLEMVSAR